MKAAKPKLAIAIRETSQKFFTEGSCNERKEGRGYCNELAT